MEYALLIPCYQPDLRSERFMEELKREICADIYVVNDGSGAQYDLIFERIGQSGIHVISYRDNHGKGYALRTGIRAICGQGRKYGYIITADSDGQHTLSDIRKVAALACEYMEDGTASPLILGVRDLSGSGVPARSRFGNRFSSIYFRYVTGVPLQDTQTGLRAVPARLFELALNTPGDRYEYEMNFLLSAADSIQTVPVSTIYEDGNRRSHFHAVRDSIRIYQTPLRYIMTSLISAAVDLTLFTLFTHLTGTFFSGIPAATASARIISGTVNFILNRVWSFSSLRAREGTALTQAFRYLLLFFFQMGASSVLVTVLSLLPLPLTLIKAFADTGLAFFSYYAQHNWVFRSGKEKRHA